MKPSEKSFTTQSSYTSSSSSTISKPPPAHPEKKATHSQRQNTNVVSSTSNRRTSDTNCGSWCFPFFFVTMWLSISLFGLAACIRGYLQETRLEHATCKVDTVYPTNEYEMEVMPKSDEAAFIVRLNATQKGIEGRNEGDTLPCYFGPDPACVHPTDGRNRTGDIFVQFDSDRRDVNAVGFGFSVLIASVFVLVGIGIMCCFLCLK